MQVVLRFEDGDVENVEIDDSHRYSNAVHYRREGSPQVHVLLFVRRTHDGRYVFDEGPVYRGAGAPTRSQTSVPTR